MAAFSFVCRSIPKLLDGRTTGLCKLSETCRHYRVLHNLGTVHISTVFKLTNFNDINIFEIKTIDGPSWTLRLALGFAVCSLGFPVYPLSFPVCPLGFPCLPPGIPCLPYVPLWLHSAPWDSILPSGIPLSALWSIYTLRGKKERKKFWAVLNVALSLLLNIILVCVALFWVKIQLDFISCKSKYRNAVWIFPSLIALSKQCL